MSKMDNLRAMREAKYAAAQKRGGGAPARPQPPVAPPVSSRRTASQGATAEGATTKVEVPAAAEGLCGHRNMSGRTCTREQGHPQKSHRYS